MTTPANIINEIVTAIRTLPLSPALTSKTCYPVAAPGYVDGQDQLVIQVALGPVNPEGAGKGSQEGGAIERVETAEITIWLRLKLDMHRRNEIVMMKAATNLMSVCAQIFDLLKYTYLKGLVTEPLWYVGESATEEYDADAGVYRRDVSFSWKRGDALPISLTYS